MFARRGRTVRLAARKRGAQPRWDPWRLASPAALALLCACLGRGYGDVARVHTDVVASMAVKVCDTLDAGRTPAARDIAEFQYPAARARQFLRQFRGEAGRPSYRQLVRLLDAYEALVRDMDRARTGAISWDRLRREGPSRCRHVAELAERTRSQLVREAAS